MCDIITFSGNSCMSMLQACVELTLDPLGRLIVMGCFANFLFFTGAFGVRKVSVAPVSEIPWSLFSEFYFGGVACACCMLGLCLIFDVITISLPDSYVLLFNAAALCTCFFDA